MNNELTIRIAGEAGQGMQTVGFALCKLFKNVGLHVFANQDYMSRIRGGNNFFQIRAGGKPLEALRAKSDIVVALDKGSVELHRPTLAPGGRLVLDKKRFAVGGSDSAFFDIPFYTIAAHTGGSELYSNSVAFGIVAGMMKFDRAAVEAVMRGVFSDKSPDIAAKNTAAAGAGYEAALKNCVCEGFSLKAGTVPGAMLMNGNDALSLGVIRAGCKFYSAYPMTPSTGVMDFLAHYARNFGIVVEQAEDEIAAINMAIGASAAGVRAMTGTSGGGFALMAEGVSLAGMTETPVVVLDAQRPAPATGFPTRTEQADLDFVIAAGHGEFARVVLAPGTIEEAFYLAVRAFNLAEKYQIPVFLMTDQHLADSYRDIGPFSMRRAQVERAIISKKDSASVSDYKRYLLTESGISPRAVPSWIRDPIYVDSDEHTEEGHITEDAGIRIRMVEKRLHKKMALLAGEAEPPAAYRTGDAQVLLIGFGSTSGVIRETVDALRPEFRVGALHFPWVWPFPADHFKRLTGGARMLITVENNAAGQFARLIRRETGVETAASVRKYDGRPFDLDGLATEANELIKRLT